VVSHFSDPSPRRCPNDAAAQPASASAAPAAFQSRLETQLGGHAAFDRFTGQILNWNDSAMAHAYALRLLAQQFPTDDSMNDRDRATLRGLARDHLAALAAPLADFDRRPCFPY